MCTTCNRTDIQVMGYSVREDRRRYVWQTQLQTEELQRIRAWICSWADNLRILHEPPLARYTEWVGWDGAKLLPAWNISHGIELYDHDGDMGDDFDKVLPLSSGSSHPELQMFDRTHQWPVAPSGCACMCVRACVRLCAFPATTGHPHDQCRRGPTICIGNQTAWRCTPQGVQWGPRGSPEFSTDIVV